MLSSFSYCTHHLLSSRRRALCVRLFAATRYSPISSPQVALSSIWILMASAIVSMLVSVSDVSLQWRKVEAMVGVSLPALQDRRPLPLFVVAHPS
jgi:hypothetical protein